MQLTNSLGSVYLTLTYDEAHNRTHCAWRGFIRLPEIQEGFDAVIDFMSEHQCMTLFSDHSGIVGPWNEGNEWLFKDWQPRAIQQGLRYWAINTGDDLFSNISLELFLTKDESTEYIVRMFEDNDSASSWLQDIVKENPLKAATKELPKANEKQPKESPKVAVVKEEKVEKNTKKPVPKPKSKP